MNAPDKIYVREFAEGVNQMWSHIKATETSAIAQHEYIRKDALLEWAKERQKYRKDVLSRSNEDWDRGVIDGLEELIDKLNSL